MSEQDKNTDVTIYLKNGDTVTRNGVSDDDARWLENLPFTDQQVSRVDATKRG
jgi:hypothetical protein